jgi:hypothetical protein
LDIASVVNGEKAGCESAAADCEATSESEQKEEKKILTRAAEWS